MLLKENLALIVSQSQTLVSEGKFAHPAPMPQVMTDRMRNPRNARVAAYSLGLCMYFPKSSLFPPFPNCFSDNVWKQYNLKEI